MIEKYIDAYLSIRFTFTEEEYNRISEIEDELTRWNAIENLVRRKLELQDYELGDTGYFPEVSCEEDELFWSSEPFDGFEF